MPVYFIEENRVITLNVSSYKTIITDITFDQKIEGTGWRMMQVNYTILVLGGEPNPMRCLSLDKGSRGEFNGVEKAEMQYARSSHAVCLAATNNGQSFLYVTGSDLRKFGLRCA